MVQVIHKVPLSQVNRHLSQSVNIENIESKLSQSDTSVVTGQDISADQLLPLPGRTHLTVGAWLLENSWSLERGREGGRGGRRRERWRVSFILKGQGVCSFLQKSEKRRQTRWWNEEMSKLFISTGAGNPGGSGLKKRASSLWPGYYGMSPLRSDGGRWRLPIHLATTHKHDNDGHKWGRRAHDSSEECELQQLFWYFFSHFLYSCFSFYDITAAR